MYDASSSTFCTIFVEPANLYDYKGGMLKKIDDGETALKASKDMDGGLTGQRRAIDPVRAMLFPRHWPSKPEARFNALRDWHDIAAQIIRANKISYRLLSTVPFCLSEDDGEIWENDRELAAMCGGCEVKSISRDVSAYKAAGVLIADYGWRERAGKKVRARRLRLSVPAKMPAYVTIRDFR